MSVTYVHGDGVRVMVCEGVGDVMVMGMRVMVMGVRVMVMGMWVRVMVMGVRVRVMAHTPVYICNFPPHYLHTSK